MYRKPGQFVPVQLEDLEKDGYEQIQLIHKPIIDDAVQTTFVVKHPHNSHMSTMVLLERTYRISYTEPDQRAQIFGAVFVDQPGFALQNIMREITMRFSTCTVTDRPSAWLPWYSRLYAKSLESSIRASGRSFATHHGTVDLDNVRRRQINTDQVRETSLLRTELAGYPTDHSSWVSLGFTNTADHNLDLLLDIEGYTAAGDAAALAACTAAIGAPGTAHSLEWLLSATEFAQRWNTLKATSETWFAADAVPAQQRTPQQHADHANYQLLVDLLATLFTNFSTSKPATYHVVLAFWKTLGDNAGGHIRYPGAGGSFAGIDVTSLPHADAGMNEHRAKVLQLVVAPHLRSEYLSNTDVLTRTYWVNGLASPATTDAALKYTIEQNNANDADNFAALKLSFGLGLRTGLWPDTCSAILELCGLDESPMSTDGTKTQFRHNMFRRPNAQQFHPFVERPFYKAFYDYSVGVYNRAVSLDQFKQTADAQNLGTFVLHDDAAYYTNTQQDTVTVKFIEPLVCGFHKPMHGDAPGCWENTGDVLPRIDGEVTYDISWLASDRLFNFRPIAGHAHGLIAWAAETTRLHTIHYRGDFVALFNQPTVKVPMHDIVVHDWVDAIDLQAPVGTAHDFQVRTTSGPPIYLLFYTAWDQHDTSPTQNDQALNLGPDISELVIRINTGQSTTFSGSCELTTAGRFHEYLPGISWDRGGILAIPWSSLPSGVASTTDIYSQQVHVEATCQRIRSNYEATLRQHYTARVRCACIYKDKFLTMNNHVQKIGWS